MKHLLKSWLPLISGTKKFLAADLSHRLSRLINRRKFEVVYEGFIDLHNIDSEQPDIVVYDKEDNLHPVMIIEFCDNENAEDTFRTIEILSRIYHIRESFVYNIENNIWYELKNGEDAFGISTYSDFFKMDLNRLLHHSGYLRLEIV